MPKYDCYVCGKPAVGFKQLKDGRLPMCRDDFDYYLAKSVQAEDSSGPYMEGTEPDSDRVTGEWPLNSEPDQDPGNHTDMEELLSELDNLKEWDLDLDETP